MVQHDTSHEVIVDAVADAVYRLIADVAGWPHLFDPTVHVDLLLEEEGAQLLRIWAMAGGAVHDWTSRHSLDALGRRIAFQRIVSKPPVAAMSGEWSVTPQGPGSCRVVLTHRFETIGAAAPVAAGIAALLAQDSAADLAAIKRAAELGAARSELHFSFSDAEMIRGSASATFDFVRRADAWPLWLPHVSRAELIEDPGGVQRLTTDTLAPDGSSQTTHSVRLCFPQRREIVYKELDAPGALMAAHTGRWQFEEGDGTVFARCWHTVTLDADGIRQEFGADASVADVRATLRRTLGAESQLTLSRARLFVERG